MLEKKCLKFYISDDNLFRNNLIFSILISLLFIVIYKIYYLYVPLILSILHLFIWQLLKHKSLWHRNLCWQNLIDSIEIRLNKFYITTTCSGDKEVAEYDYADKVDLTLVYNDCDVNYFNYNKIEAYYRLQINNVHFITKNLRLTDRSGATNIPNLEEFKLYDAFKVLPNFSYSCEGNDAIRKEIFEYYTKYGKFPCGTRFKNFSRAVKFCKYSKYFIPVFIYIVIFIGLILNALN